MLRTCCVHKVFWMSKQKQKTICVHNMFLTCSELGIFMYWTRNSMNNLSSYCGLVEAKMRASNKYLPVLSIFFRTYAPQSIGAGYPNESDGTLTYGNALRCSCLIYNPNRRNDIWRFGTYMFLHSGWHHLFWNIGIQLMVGEFTSLKGFSASNCDVGRWIFYIFFRFYIFY